MLWRFLDNGIASSAEQWLDLSLTKRSLKGSYWISEGGAMLHAPVDSPYAGPLIPPFQSSLVKLPPISLDSPS